MPDELTQEQKLEVWQGHALALSPVKPDVVAVKCKCGFSKRAPAWAAADRRVTGVLIVPASALPGPHTVTATGMRSGLSASSRFLVRTNWTRFHFDLYNSGFNPYENVLNPSNVSGLVLKWKAKTQ